MSMPSTTPPPPSGPSMPPTSPPSDPQVPHSRRGSRSLWPFLLITLGVVFLLGNVLGNVVPERGRGGLILVGLGVAFLIGRLTTGRYGYAVPAGLLIALGMYISLPFVGSPQPVSGAGWFFVLLGLGFALIYVFGMRPWRVWPLFPATVLACLGLVLFGVTSLAPLASLSWIVSLWPAALVLLGVWLLFREYLPVPTRRAVGTLGGIALLLYGVLAAASSVAAGGALARTGLAPAFGTSPFADTLTLVGSIQPGQTLTVDNANGKTTVRVGADPAMVHVVATRHFSMAGQGPNVALNPSAEGLTLETPTMTGGGGFAAFGGSSWVDYAIEVPAGIAVRAQASSGAVDIDGVSAAVTARATSGSVNLANLTGPVDVQTSSGSITLTNVAGTVSAATSSGQIRGTQLQHLTSAQTNSGLVQLEGVFTDAATVRTSSGSVELGLGSGSNVRLDVQTGSGSISTDSLALSGVNQQRNSLQATLGSPAADATLRIQTSSGSVRLTS